MGIFSRPYDKKKLKKGELHYFNERELTPFGCLFLFGAVVVNFLVIVFAGKEWSAISVLVTLGAYFLIKYLVDGSIDD